MSDGMNRRALLRLAVFVAAMVWAYLAHWLADGSRWAEAAYLKMVFWR